MGTAKCPEASLEPAAALRPPPSSGIDQCLGRAARGRPPCPARGALRPAVSRGETAEEEGASPYNGCRPQTEQQHNDSRDACDAAAAVSVPASVRVPPSSPRGVELCTAALQGRGDLRGLPGGVPPGGSPTLPHTQDILLKQVPSLLLLLHTS